MPVCGYFHCFVYNVNNQYQSDKHFYLNSDKNKTVDTNESQIY